MSQTFEAALRRALERIEEESESPEARNSIAAELRTVVEAEPPAPGMGLGARVMARRAMGLLERACDFDKNSVVRLLMAAMPVTRRSSTPAPVASPVPVAPPVPVASPVPDAPPVPVASPAPAIPPPPAAASVSQASPALGTPTVSSAGAATISSPGESAAPPPRDASPSLAPHPASPTPFSHAPPPAGPLSTPPSEIERVEILGMANSSERPRESPPETAARLIPFTDAREITRRIRALSQTPRDTENEPAAPPEVPPHVPPPVIGPPTDMDSNLGSTSQVLGGSAETDTAKFEPVAASAEHPADLADATEPDMTEYDDSEPGELPTISLAETDTETLREFLTEAADYLGAAEAALMALEADPEDADSVAAVFRAFHTIKGVAGFLGLQALADLAHHAESLLGRIRSGEIRCVGVPAELSFESVDVMRGMFALIAEAEEGGDVPVPPQFGPLLKRLMNPDLTVARPAAPPSAPRPVVAAVPASKAAPQPQPTPSPSPAAAPALADVDSDDEDGPPTRPIDVHEVEERARPTRTAAARSESISPSGDDANRGASTTGVKQAPKQAPSVDKSGRNASDATIRVRTDRLDRLIDMVGELVIAQAMLWEDELVRTSGSLVLQNKVSQANKIVRELHDSTLSLRMVPLRSTFQKAARVARDVSVRTKKPVQVVVEGDDTEIDRNTVELLADPLVHMVRNAIDHGVEDAEGRQASGKDGMAQLAIRAFRAGSDVVIEVEDDGKGVDPSVVFRKAVQRGVVMADTTLSEAQTLALIFEPGFSTRDQVSELSGRGVGLDVVKRAVEALKGSISVNSTVGEGTRFGIRLPLTLAMTDGLLVRLGDFRYVIPIVNISESICPDADAICSIAERGEFVLARGELVPIIRLSDIFGLESRPLSEGLFVILTAGAHRFAVLVDEVLGQQQVVAKSLGPLRASPTIAGGAILGDGRVGLILDPSALLAWARRGASSSDAMVSITA